LIEPDPRAFGLLKRRFEGRDRVKCLPLACGAAEATLRLGLGRFTTHSALQADDGAGPMGDPTSDTVEVRVRRLSAVLEEMGLPKRYGVLSIDTEGFDLEVLEGADLGRWRPDVIFTENFEPKEAGKRELLQRNGYELRDEVDNNTVWTPKDGGAR